MNKLILAATVSVVAIGGAQSTLAADEGHMLDKCRKYAASHLRVSPSIINVKYEGQRTDGTHAVNGDAESKPPMTFQCSFNSQGTRVVRWVYHSPEGCPSDVTEADRYKYPDCN